jgi:hypothetical protein
VLKPDDSTTTSRADTYHYGSGVELSGHIGQARVSIGGQDTDAAIPVQLVEAKRCLPGKPCQGAAALSLDDYGLGGDGIAHAGFKAIIGVSMGEAPAINPLTRIGDRAWIIVLPRPQEASDGELTLNPTSEDRAGYAPLAVDPQFAGAQGNFHDAIPGCLARESGGPKLCGPTVLDTGAPGVKVDLGAHDRPLRLTPGEAALIAFEGPGGRPVGARFVVARGAGAFVAETAGDGHPRTRIGAGILPFFAFSVLYDDKAGKVGLKPR